MRPSPMFCCALGHTFDLACEIFQGASIPPRKRAGADCEGALRKATHSGWALGPTMMKSLYTSNLAMPISSATNSSSCAMAWTNATSASPSRAISSACPVPCAILDVYSDLGLEDRQDAFKEAPILRRCRGSDDD